MISNDIWQAFDTWGWDRHQYAATTRALYGRRCRAAERWMQPTSLHHATSADVTGWHQSLPATAASRNVGRQALVAWFDFLRDRTTRTTNPAAELPTYKYPDPVPRALNRDQACAVLAVPAEPQWSFATSLLFHSALRATEARTLEWGRVLDGWVQVTVKGGRERVLPMHPHTSTLADVWRRLCPSPRWVFPSPVTTGPLSDSAWRRRIKATALEAGVTMTPHVARHSTATRMVEQGVDVRVISELLGHASLATTMRYLRARPQRLADSVGGLDFAA